MPENVDNFEPVYHYLTLEIDGSIARVQLDNILLFEGSPQRGRAALKGAEGSLTLLQVPVVVFVSENDIGKKLEHKWVPKDIEFTEMRKHIKAFSKRHKLFLDGDRL